MYKYISRIPRAYITALVLLVVFLFGWALGSVNPQLSASSLTQKNITDGEAGNVTGKEKSPPSWLGDDVDFSLFWDVWERIQNQYVDRPAAEPKLLYGSIHGLVAALEDPFSNFLEPQTAENFAETLSGKFEGIGAEIGIRNNRLTIISPLPESPAEQAGLRGGDAVFAIDGFDTTNISLDEAVHRIRGEKGTPVVLQIYREGASDLQDITIIRDTIKIVSVIQETKQTPQGKNISYIRITNFNADTASRFQKAVNDSLARGVNGFIIDMRNNPGGFLDKAIEISSYWVPNGKTVVQERFSGDRVQTHFSTGPGQLKEFETVVLINGGSASGSEIFAGALQDHGLAQLVGTRTFGKGSVQDLINFDNGSALKLTIARWLTPNGTVIDKEGVHPNVEIDITEEDVTEDRDPQLDKALELFDGEGSNEE